MALDKVIDIDQSPIGRTPRSNPATYTGLFTFIRDLFSNLPESRVRGYKPGRYSFNVKGGRCEACQGDGLIKIEMHFLPDVYVTCEVCKGQRYNRETLEIQYKGRSIADVLNMTVDDALEFFEHIPLHQDEAADAARCRFALREARASPPRRLSGGEAQRVKLSRELSKRPTGRTHVHPGRADDRSALRRHAAIARCAGSSGRGRQYRTRDRTQSRRDPNADWIIDLGPEGGDRGGEIVAEGPPKDIAKVKRSYTGQVLKEAGIT